MSDLFESPISKTKVRNGIFAYKYRNGCINIEGEKYFFYSIKDAIKDWRSKNPKHYLEKYFL
jgi:YHS domain-containing protein